MDSKLIKPIEKILFTNVNVNLHCITEYKNYNSSTLSNALSDWNYEVEQLRDNDINYYTDSYNFINDLIPNYDQIIFIGCKELNQIINLVSKFNDKKFFFISDRTSDYFNYNFSNNSNLEFIHSNLHFYSQTEIVYRTIKNDKKSLIVLIDVLEHLIDPLPTLRLVKNLLRLNKESKVIFTTYNRKEKYNDIPKNLSHVREWRLEEIVQFLKSLGFNIEEIYESRSNDFYENQDSILIKANVKGYKKFIKKNFNVDLNKYYFLVTNEHPDLKQTGGIGSYTKEITRLCGDLIHVLFIEITDKHYQECWQKGFLHPFLFIDQETLNDQIQEKIGHIFDYPVALLTYKFIYYLNYFFDIGVIEFPDTMGYGMRIIQAQKAGLLQKELIIRVSLHATHFHIAKGNNVFLYYTVWGVAYFEKYAIENASVLTGPSNFLINLYKSFGVEVPKHAKVLPLPFDLNKISNLKILNVNFQKIRRIVFIGRVTKLKGYDIFLSAIQKLIDQGVIGEGKQINSIEVWAPFLTLEPEIKEKHDKISSKVQINQSHLQTHELLIKLQEYKEDTLFVYPYRTDNYPVAVLEALVSGVNFVAANAGGIPEMIDKKFHDYVLFELNANSLTEIINKYLNYSTEHRQKLANEISDCARQKIKQDNQNVRNTVIHLLNEWHNTQIKSYKFELRPSLTLIIPVYNTKLEQVEDAIYSVNVQRTKVQEVIVVDDGSEEEYYKKLEILLRKKAKFNYRLIRHEINKGLPAARNMALKHIQTRYVANLDSDDCLHPEFITLVANYFLINDEVAGAACFIKRFKEREKPQRISESREMFHPICQNLALNYFGNTFAPASNVYVTDVLKKVGGWDDSNKNAYEDHALGFKLTQLGYKIDVIPEYLYLHRIRMDSMSHTYSVSDGLFRLVENSILIPKFDAYIQLSIYRYLYDLMSQKYVRMDFSNVINPNTISFRLFVKVYNKIYFLINSKPQIKKAFLITKSLLKKVYFLLIKKK